MTEGRFRRLRWTMWISTIGWCFHGAPSRTERTLARVQAWWLR